MAWICAILLGTGILAMRGTLVNNDMRQHLHALVASTLRAIGTRVADLERKTTALEAVSAGNKVQIDSYEKRLDNLEKAKDQAEHSALVAAAASDTQAKHIDYLESLLQVSNAANQVQLPPGVFGEGAGLDDPDVDADNDTIGPLSHADTIMEKNPLLRRVILESLEHLCGVPHFRDLQYLVYPTIPKDHPNWPSSIGPDGKSIPLMRLNLMKPFTEAENWEQIQRLADYVMERGHSLTPEATEILQHTSRRIVLAGCKYRFKYLKGELQRKLKASNEVENRAVGQNTVTTNLLAGNSVAGNEIDPALDSSLMQQYQARIPKHQLVTFAHEPKAQRELLTGEEYEVYREPKYDSFFTPGAQSDDETEYRLDNGQWVKTGKFVSRAPEFESDERRKCRDAVAAIKDPNDRARPVERVRGNLKPGAPRKAESLQWAIREWMVDPETLRAHPEWVTKGLVVGNGIAWGDASEPAVLNARKRARRSNNVSMGAAGPGALAEQARNARRTYKDAQKRAEELQNEVAKEGDHESMAVD
ncbi:unnamed protein product [Rhizoctonia solani]|uniref:Uncharacterized protein n=1 Tax=Rhizoctonia solani TaxID=456999 RepID=A0A8H2WJ65_9AGAM|nr:unnamed protein product [Rhizoctonia solani]